MAVITKREGSKVAVAFGVAAASSALIIALAPWAFRHGADVARFQIFWAALFIFSGVLTGLNLEVTRVISTPAAPVEDSARLGTKNPKIVATAAALGLGLAIVLAATSGIWGRWQFADSPTALALLIALGVLGWAGDQAIVGALAGSGRWGLYSGLITAGATARLIMVVAVALFTQSVVAAALATVASFFTWILWLLLSKQTRSTLSVRSDANLSTTLSRFGAAALATGSSAIVGIGLPALLGLTTAKEIIDANPQLLLAITLTRAPLMIPLNAVQGIVIAHFSRSTGPGIRALWPFLRLALLVGVAAVAAAWLLGPWLLTAIWGVDYYVSGPILGGLTAGATGLAVLTLCGAVCQSSRRHRAFLVGWLAAVATTILALLVNLPLANRAVLALCVGPVVGIVIQLIALTKTPPESQTEVRAA